MDMKISFTARTHDHRQPIVDPGHIAFAESAMREFLLPIDSRESAALYGLHGQSTQNLNKERR